MNIDFGMGVLIVAMAFVVVVWAIAVFTKDKPKPQPQPAPMPQDDAKADAKVWKPIAESLSRLTEETELRLKQLECGESGHSWRIGEIRPRRRGGSYPLYWDTPASITFVCKTCGREKSRHQTGDDAAAIELLLEDDQEGR